MFIHKRRKSMQTEKKFALCHRRDCVCPVLRAHTHSPSNLKVRQGAVFQFHSIRFSQTHRQTLSLTRKKKLYLRVSFIRWCLFCSAAKKLDLILNSVRNATNIFFSASYKRAYTYIWWILYTYHTKRVLFSRRSFHLCDFTGENRIPSQWCRAHWLWK